MIQIGYKLSSEEHSAPDLVRYAQRAEAIGFDFCAISDHYFPWVDTQGHSPFVWSVLGALAYATKRMHFFTAVTCPTFRIHPAIVAQAVATSASLLPGRFAFGIGTGEYLNEHILGQKFPKSGVRLAMLKESLEIMRQLWSGEFVSHEGKHFTIESARLYSLPEEPPKVYVAASGSKTATFAGEAANGLIGVSPDGKAVKAFQDSGGDGKPVLGELHVCWAESAKEARETAITWWPNIAIEGLILPEMRLPSHFEEIAKITDPDKIAEKFVLGSKVQDYVSAIKKYVDAGFDHVWIHQTGPDQDGFFDFVEADLLPALRKQKIVSDSPWHPDPPEPVRKQPARKR